MTTTRPHTARLAVASAVAAAVNSTRISTAGIAVGTLVLGYDGEPVGQPEHQSRTLGRSVVQSLVWFIIITGSSPTIWIDDNHQAKHGRLIRTYRDLNTAVL